MKETSIGFTGLAASGLPGYLERRDQSSGSRAIWLRAARDPVKKGSQLRVHGLGGTRVFGRPDQPSHPNFLSLVTALNLTPYKASTDTS